MAAFLSSSSERQRAKDFVFHLFRIRLQKINCLLKTPHQASSDQRLQDNKNLEWQKLISVKKPKRKPQTEE